MRSGCRDTNQWLVQVGKKLYRWPTGSRSCLFWTAPWWWLEGVAVHSELQRIKDVELSRVTVKKMEREWQRERVGGVERKIKSNDLRWSLTGRNQLRSGPWWRHFYFVPCQLLSHSTKITQKFTSIRMRILSFCTFIFKGPSGSISRVYDQPSPRGNLPLDRSSILFIVVASEPI